VISGGRLRHGDRERDGIGDGRGDANGDAHRVERGPGVVLDEAPTVHGPSPMSEKGHAYWLGQGGRGRRAVPQESHVRVRMRVCAYTGSLYTTVHYVHPVRPFCSNGFRGRGDAGASAQPAPGHVGGWPRNRTTLAPVEVHDKTPNRVCTGGRLYLSGCINSKLDPAPRPALRRRQRPERRVGQIIHNSLTSQNRCSERALSGVGT